MKFLQKLPAHILLALIATLLFIPFLKSVPLFDWDEINFAESAREMLLSKNFSQVQIDYMPFWEKPPLFIWLQAACMSVFGVNEYAARFPNAICGIITIVLLYFLGKRLYSKLFGVLWSLMYAGSLLPNFYFHTGIIDPVFNLFIFLSIYFLAHLTFETEFFDYKGKRRTRFAMAFAGGAFLGLAVMTKGPVAILIVALCTALYFALSKGKKLLSFRDWIVFLLALLLFSCGWYAYETWKHGWWYLQEFIDYQIRLFRTGDAGHAGFPLYHFVVVFIGCFPASIFIFGGLQSIKTDSINQRNYKRWMLALLIVVLVVFSIVKTKIIHYSSLTYFPISFLAAYSLYHFIKKEKGYNLISRMIFLLMLLLFSTALIALPFIGKNMTSVLGNFSFDEFTRACLQAPVKWERFDSWVGICFLLNGLTFYYFFLHRKQALAPVWYLLIQAMLLQAIFVQFIPRIENYTQAAAVEFYKSKRDEDCYVYPLGFKSYAHLFYSRAKPSPELPSFTNSDDKVYYLLHQPVSKAVYFVAQLHKAEKFKKEYGLTELYRENGFVFLKK